MSQAEKHAKFWEYLEGVEFHNLLQNYRFRLGDVGVQIATLRGALMLKAEEIYGKEASQVEESAQADTSGSDRAHQRSSSP